MGILLALLAGHPTPAAGETPLAAAATTFAPTATSAPAAPSVNVFAEDPVVVVPQAPSATSRTHLIEETFDTPSERWITGRTSTSSRAYVDGGYELRLSGQPELGVTNILPLTQYRLSVDLAIAEGNAGLILLALKPATFYRLLISDQGSFALQLYDQQQGTTRNVVNWTSAAALQRTASSTYRLVIERSTATVRVFADDTLLGEFGVPEGDVINQYGFVLSSESNRGQATFDNLVIDQLGP